MMRPKLTDVKRWLKNMMSRFPYFDFKFWSKRVEKALATFQASAAKSKSRRLSPAVFVVAMLWTIVTIGVCIGSFFTLFASLLLLYFIFTRLFGFDLKTDGAVII